MWSVWRSPSSVRSAAAAMVLPEDSMYFEGSGSAKRKRGKGGRWLGYPKVQPKQKLGVTKFQAHPKVLGAQAAPFTGSRPIPLAITDSL